MTEELKVKHLTLHLKECIFMDSIWKEQDGTSKNIYKNQSLKNYSFNSQLCM